MANINLLPWRDEYRHEKKREFFSILLLLALLAALISGVWIFMTKEAIEDQKARTALLKKEIALLDEKVKEIERLKKRREQLETRMDVIQGLQRKRPLSVRYFDEMVRAVPEGLYFDSLKLVGDTFNISGIAESNSRVSRLMRNLDNSKWFDAPNLKNVISDKFDLSVKAMSPNETQEGDG